MKNLLHETHDFQPIEPIDLARGQLDFAAMAAATPSIKNILFKAQTMGPMVSKPSPWKMTMAAAGVVAALGVVVWPWIPVHRSISILQVGFEQDIQRDEAQRLVNKLLRSGEPDVILGAEFSSSAGQGDEANPSESGHLRISLFGPGTSAQRLQDSYASKIREASERQLDPLFQVSARERSTDWTSPLQLAVSKLRGAAASREASEDVEEPGEDLAIKVRQSAPLLKQALGAEISGLNRGYELREFRFLSRYEDAAREGMDFSLPAWPTSVGVRISLYETLTMREQAELRGIVESFLNRSGLGPQQSSLSSAPQDWQPIMVRVFSNNGRYDRLLSEKLQAFLVQPSEEDTRALNYDPSKYVDEAMQRFMPSLGYVLETNPDASLVRGRTKHFEFNVRLGGVVAAPSSLEREVSKLDPGDDESSSTEDW